MLNQFAFQLFTDREKMPEDTLRFFSQLMVDFDLTVWRALSFSRIRHLYGIKESGAKRHIQILLRCGLLEPGPVLRESGQTHPTYRIADEYLLGEKELAGWVRDLEQKRERRMLVKEPRKGRGKS